MSIWCAVSATVAICGSVSVTLLSSANAIDDPLSNAAANSTLGTLVIASSWASFGLLKGLQVLNEVALLLRRQRERSLGVVGRDHRVEGGGAAVVEIGRVLPDTVERRGPVLLRGAARGVAR